MKTNAEERLQKLLLLIAPEGIEIRKEHVFFLYSVELLIAPEGIEMKTYTVS